LPTECLQQGSTFIGNYSLTNGYTALKTNFNIVFLLSNEGVEKINKQYTVYLPDWVTINEQMKLKYKKTGSLTYMVLVDKKPEWEINKTINIKWGNTLSGIEDFSIVQGRGFCETEEEFNMGYLWMREKI
jgi:hypothetical protein